MDTRPVPIKEWEYRGAELEGDTLTVVLQVFAGIDVYVTLDGAKADQVTAVIPTLEFIFRGVEAGERELAVRDIVGFEQSGLLVVPLSQPAPVSNPKWLDEMIRAFEGQGGVKQPQFVARYEYLGETVYYFSPQCCDRFSDLYDARGNLLGHPDGGITGQGDGSFLLFSSVRKDEVIIWPLQDAARPSLSQTSAPIEWLEVMASPGSPGEFMLRGVFALPNGCASYAGYMIDRSGDTVQAEVANWKPVDEEVACDQAYRSEERSISLGSGYELGRKYDLNVNGMTLSFGGD